MYIPSVNFQCGFAAQNRNNYALVTPKNLPEYALVTPKNNYLV